MHAIAHGKCMDTVRVSGLKVGSGRKIPFHTGESNLRRQRAGPMLYQLSYIPTFGTRGPGSETLLSLTALGGKPPDFPWEICHTEQRSSELYKMHHDPKGEVSCCGHLYCGQKCCATFTTPGLLAPYNTRPTLHKLSLIHI